MTQNTADYVLSAIKKIVVCPWHLKLLWDERALLSGRWSEMMRNGREKLQDEMKCLQLQSRNERREKSFSLLSANLLAFLLQILNYRSLRRLMLSSIKISSMSDFISDMCGYGELTWIRTWEVFFLPKLNFFDVDKKKFLSKFQGTWNFVLRKMMMHWPVNFDEFTENQKKFYVYVSGTGS